jgi:hypothetical protein
MKGIQMTKIGKLIASLTVSLVLTASAQGCAIGVIAGGICAARCGSAKQKEAYANYRNEMEKINLEREKEGLETKPILTYDEWKKGEK